MKITVILIILNIIMGMVYYDKSPSSNDSTHLSFKNINFVKINI